MKIKQLFEGLSPILFHATSMEGATSILKDNKFRLSPDITSNFEKTHRLGDKVYYMSTSRTKSGAFIGRTAVTFTLDGRKLAANHAGAPVEFFGSRQGRGTHSETEDRVFSSKPDIKNASKFIKEVHIMISDKNSLPARNSKLRKLLLVVKKHNIPYWLYDDERAYKLQNKLKAVSLSSLDVTGVNTDMPIYQLTTKQEDDLKFWILLYNANKTSDLPDKVYKELSYITHSAEHEWLQNVIRNAKTSNYHGKTRKLVETLISIMQKERIGDLKEFVDFIVNKWKRIVSKEKQLKRINNPNSLTLAPSLS